MALIRSVRKDDVFTISHEATEDKMDIIVKRKEGVNYIVFAGKEYKVNISKKSKDEVFKKPE